MIEDVLKGQSKYHIEQGDVLDVLASWPAECVQTCVTSPPYWGLRSYLDNGHESKHLELGSESTPEEYVEKMVQVFRAVRRVLRKDGTVWCNLGCSYAGSGKAHGDDKTLNKGALAARGINAYNVPSGFKPKDLIMIPFFVAEALRQDGWYLRSTIIWSKNNPMPESVTDRPTTSHEYIYLLSRSADYYYDADAIREPHETRIFTARQDGDNAEKWHAHGEGDGKRYAVRYNNPAGRNRRTVWEVPTAPLAAAHFATFPPKLIEPCILAGSRPGDVVLDPFMGAGTTALVALRHNRRALGAELNQEYIDMADRRIAGDERANQMHMELTA